MDLQDEVAHWHDRSSWPHVKVHVASMGKARLFVKHCAEIQTDTREEHLHCAGEAAANENHVSQLRIISHSGSRFDKKQKANLLGTNLELT